MTSIFERAKAYPFVDQADYLHSSRVLIDTGRVEPVCNQVLIEHSPFTQTLAGTDISLPSYNLIFNDGSSLSSRIAIIAIGSNSSPQVLIKKFAQGNIGGGFFIAQSNLEHHAVVHGAFLGRAGTVPATVVPHKDTTTQITVSFLTPEQAEVLTQSEPNYDLVYMNQAIGTVGLSNSPVIKDGALLYVSPWKSLTEDGANPLAQSAIPANTRLKSVPSEYAMKLISKALSPDQTTEAFFNGLAQDTEEARLLRNISLQNGALPARFTGIQVRESLAASQAVKYGLPVPVLTYLKA